MQRSEKTSADETAAPPKLCVESDTVWKVNPSFEELRGPKGNPRRPRSPLPVRIPPRYLSSGVRFEVRSIRHKSMWTSWNQPGSRHGPTPGCFQVASCRVSRNCGESHALGGRQHRGGGGGSYTEEEACLEEGEPERPPQTLVSLCRKKQKGNAWRPRSFSPRAGSSGKTRDQMLSDWLTLMCILLSPGASNLLIDQPFCSHFVCFCFLCLQKKANLGSCFSWPRILEVFDDFSGECNLVAIFEMAKMCGSVSIPKTPSQEQHCAFLDLGGRDLCGSLPNWALCSWLFPNYVSICWFTWKKLF